MALLVLALAGTTVASAQPSAPRRPQAHPPPRSTWVATGLAVGVTSAGLAIGSIADGIDPHASSPLTLAAFGVGYAALVAGPSAGHWYAGERWHALRWTAIRTAGLTAAVGGIYLAFDATDDDRNLVPGILLATAGTAAFATGLAWSLFDAHGAAHRANARTRPAYGVQPLLLPGGTGIGIAGTL